MNRISGFLSIILMLLSMQLGAGQATVFEHTVDKPMSKVYPAMQASFEDSRFFVVDELNIGKNLSNFSEKWGDDYNRNKLTGFRSIVFCNGWYANEVSNADPTMLALCPLRMTLIEKQGSTRILFARPTVIAGDSPARKILSRVEADVIAVIKKSTANKSH